MKLISAKHQEFIRLVSNGTLQGEAYKLSVGKSGVSRNVADVKGSQLAKRYSKEIQQAKKASAKAVQHANESSDAQIALKQVLTQIEVDAKLCSIINGTFEYEDVIPVNGKLMPFAKKPNASDTIKAIDLYNKRFGSNATEKKDITLIKGWDNFTLENE